MTKIGVGMCRTIYMGTAVSISYDKWFLWLKICCHSMFFVQASYQLGANLSWFPNQIFKSYNLSLQHLEEVDNIFHRQWQNWRFCWHQRIANVLLFEHLMKEDECHGCWGEECKKCNKCDFFLLFTLNKSQSSNSEEWLS